MGYDVPATRRVTDAQALVLLTMVRHAQQSGRIPPDKILAQELGRDPRTINNHRLQLVSAGILERAETGHQLADDIISDSQMAQVAIFASRLLAEHPLTENALKRAIEIEFGISRVKLDALMEQLVVNGYLDVEGQRVTTGECLQYELNYLQLLADSGKTKPAA